MSVIQFVTSKEFGCCTVAELMAYNKQDKEGYQTLRLWAEQEMKNRGINVDVPKSA